MDTIQVEKSREPRFYICLVQDLLSGKSPYADFESDVLSSIVPSYLGYEGSLLSVNGLSMSNSVKSERIAHLKL